MGTYLITAFWLGPLMLQQAASLWSAAAKLLTAVDQLHPEAQGCQAQICQGWILT